MARLKPGNEPDLREYLLAEAVELRRLMVETLIEIKRVSPSIRRDATG